MVYPSVPLYLDTPSWNQQHIHQQIIGNGTSDDLPHPRPSDGALRPNSMAERARLAKIPQQELALNCPRCDSTNTKFCYFNNYSLTQPRHFCKTCRRYWTRGGALRSIPVGGGSRRNNKRSSSSKSTSATSNDKPINIIGGAPPSSTAKSTVVPSSLPGLPPRVQFLNPMVDFDSGTTNIGLGFHGMQVDHHFQPGGGGGMEQWRPLNHFHHFPFLGGLESELPPIPATGSELASQFASVKMVDTPNTARHQFWDVGSIGVPGSSNGGWMAELFDPVTQTHN